MSSPLAIGAVSAVLRNLLDNGLVDVGAPLGSVEVTAVAPGHDQARRSRTRRRRSTSSSYRTSPNQGWRDAGLPAYDGNGARLSNPPLALDLHYLLTAYGSADFQAEILLGYAMHLLHERPVLDRASIRKALDPSPLGPSILPPAFQALGRLRPRRPDRGRHGHARADGQRGDVAAVVGDRRRTTGRRRPTSSRSS